MRGRVKGCTWVRGYISKCILYWRTSNLHVYCHRPYWNLFTVYSASFKRWAALSSLEDPYLTKGCQQISPQFHPTSLMQILKLGVILFREPTPLILCNSQPGKTTPFTSLMICLSLTHIFFMTLYLLYSDELGKHWVVGQLFGLRDKACCLTGYIEYSYVK